MLTSLLTLLLAHSALAASPIQAILGDWDLGANSPAFQITQKDEASIFVQLCDRSTLLNTHVCNANVILYFNFSEASQDFTHDESSGQHLHATLQVDNQDPDVIHYIFTSDVGSGDLTGRKI